MITIPYRPINSIKKNQNSIRKRSTTPLLKIRNKLFLHYTRLYQALLYTENDVETVLKLINPKYTHTSSQYMYI